MLVIEVILIDSTNKTFPVIYVIQFFNMSMFQKLNKIHLELYKLVEDLVESDKVLIQSTLTLKYFRFTMLLFFKYLHSH